MAHGHPLNSPRAAASAATQTWCAPQRLVSRCQTAGFTALAGGLEQQRAVRTSCSCPELLVGQQRSLQPHPAVLRAGAPCNLHRSSCIRSLGPAELVAQSSQRATWLRPADRRRDPEVGEQQGRPPGRQAPGGRGSRLCRALLVLLALLVPQVAGFGRIGHSCSIFLHSPRGLPGRQAAEAGPVARRAPGGG